MALTETVLTGRFPFADDVVPASAVAKFVLSGVDVEGGDVVLPYERRVALTAGALPGGFALWSNGAGGRGTHYEVTVEIIQPAYFGPLNTTTAIPVGFLVVPAVGGPYAVADLLVWTPPGPTAVDVLALAQAAALVATTQAGIATTQAGIATGAAADALASAAAAALYDGPRVDTFAQLVALTAGDVAVGEYVQVRSLGAWYKRAADAASDSHLTHTSAVLKWYVMPSAAGYAIEAWGLDQYSTAAEVAAVIAKAIAKLQSGQKIYQKAWEYNCDAVAVTTNIRNVSITLRTKFVGTGTGEIAYLIGVKDSLIDWSIDGNGADRNAIRLEDCGGSRVPQTAKFQNLIGNTQLVAAVFIRNSPNMEITPTITNCYSVGFKAVRGVMISDTSISENRSLVRPFIEEGGVTIYACAWNASGNTATRATYDAYPAGWQYWDSQALIGYKRVGSSGWATIPDYASGNTAERAAYDAQAAGFNYWDSQALIGYRRTGGSGWTALVNDADGVYAESTVVNHIGGLRVIGGVYNNCQKRFIKIATNNPIIMDNVGRNTLGASMFAMIGSHRPDAGVIYNNHMTTTGAVYSLLTLGVSFGAEFNASGNTAGRSAYDAQAEGYVYYDTTTGTGYRRTGVSGWTAFGIGPWVTFDTNNNDLRAGVVDISSRAVEASIKIRNGRIGDGDRFTGCRYMMRGYGIADTVAGTEKETLDLTFSLFDKLNGTTAPAIVLDGSYDRVNICGGVFRGDTAGFYLVSAANIASGVIDISDVRHGYSEFCQYQRPRNAIDQRWGETDSFKFEGGRKIHLRDNDPTGAAALEGDEVLRKTFSLGGWLRRVCSVAGTPGTFVTYEDAGKAPPLTKTANFTVADGEKNLINNKSGSTCTVTLPVAASYPGRELTFQNWQAQLVVSATSNVIPLAGGTAGAAILAASIGAGARLVSDGTNWQIVP